MVAYVPEPQDFTRIQNKQWYRIPLQHAPKGLHAEYIAFYFGGKYGDRKWAVHYYARNLGHELTMRRELLPDQSQHPHADEIYYKIQLGELQRLPQPIISLRWRRVTFIHTTWDRFQDAAEINDLFLDGGPYVDRLYATLKEKGVQAEKNYLIRERAAVDSVALAVLCRDGLLKIRSDQVPDTISEIDRFAEGIVARVSARGGVREVEDRQSR